MPNWCYTHITIRHEDESVIERLENLINKWTSKDYIKNGFGNNWLGNIVGNSGVGIVKCEGEPNKETEEVKYLFCRGEICDVYRNGNELIITEESAWSPAVKMWLKVIDKYASGSELIYSAEECGCDLYMTNDEDHLDHYYLDWWEQFPEEYAKQIKSLNWATAESDDAVTEDNVLKFLTALLPEVTEKEDFLAAKKENSKEKMIDVLLKAFYETELCEHCGIHKWDWVDAIECE